MAHWVNIVFSQLNLHHEGLAMIVIWGNYLKTMQLEKMFGIAINFFVNMPVYLSKFLKQSRYFNNFSLKIASEPFTLNHFAYSKQTQQIFFYVIK